MSTIRHKWRKINDYTWTSAREESELVRPRPNEMIRSALAAATKQPEVIPKGGE